MLIAAKERDVLKERLNLLSGDILLINQRITTKDSIINALHTKDYNNQTKSLAMAEQRSALEEQKKVLTEQVAALEKIIRRMKRKQFFTAAGGVLATGVMVFIAATK